MHEYFLVGSSNFLETSLFPWQLHKDNKTTGSHCSVRKQSSQLPLYVLDKHDMNNIRFIIWSLALIFSLDSFFPFFCKVKLTRCKPWLRTEWTDDVSWSLQHVCGPDLDIDCRRQTSSPHPGVFLHQLPPLVWGEVRLALLHLSQLLLVFTQNLLNVPKVRKTHRFTLLTRFINTFTKSWNEKQSNNHK